MRRDIALAILALIYSLAFFQTLKRFCLGTSFGESSAQDSLVPAEKVCVYRSYKIPGVSFSSSYLQNISKEHPIKQYFSLLFSQIFPALTRRKPPTHNHHNSLSQGCVRKHYQPTFVLKSSPSLPFVFLQQGVKQQIHWSTNLKLIGQRKSLISTPFSCQ